MLKAIETRYKGYRFRSRLEARWAVFFDAIGQPFEYEMEGFDIGDGLYYLPDFWLPRQKAWFEVKGVEPGGDDARKLQLFAKGISGDTRFFLAIGGIILDDDEIPSGDWDCGIQLMEGDFPYFWCVCQSGPHFDIHYYGRGERCYCGCAGSSSGRFYSNLDQRLIQAREEARAYRF